LTGRITCCIVATGPDVISKGRHPKADVAAALDFAATVGMQVRQHRNGHRWGWLECPWCGARMAIWGTPRSPGSDGKRIRRFGARHAKEGGGRR